MITKTANNLIKIRKDMGLCSAGMAAALGLKPPTYCQYETGKRAIPLSVLDKLRHEFKIDINRIFD